MKKTKLLLTTTALLSAVSITPVLTGCANTLSPSKKDTIVSFAVGGIKYETLSADTVKAVKYDGAKPETLTIPDTVTNPETTTTYRVVEIGSRAFESCIGLTSVSIGSNVTKIGAKAFNYCKALKTVTVGVDLAIIDEFAFASCRSLESINLPDSIAKICDGAFQGCTKLASISAFDSLQVESIGISAFKECSALSSFPSTPRLTSIGSSAFKGCTSLTSFKVEPTVKTIGELAFADSGLASLEFTNKTYWSTIGDKEDKDNHFEPLDDKSACVEAYKAKQQFFLTRYNPITSISLSPTTTSPFSGEEVQIKAFLNDGATAKTLKWTSNLPDIAPVDENGVVKFSPAATTESVVITATAQDGSGVTQTQSLTCQGNPIKSFKLEEDPDKNPAICFKADGTKTYNATVELKEGVDEKYKKVIWTVDNVDGGTDPLAAIDPDTGVLTALDDRVGVVRVTATSAYSSTTSASYEVCINTVFDIRNKTVENATYRACCGFAPHFTSDVVTKINTLWPDSSTPIRINDDTVKLLEDSAFSSLAKPYYKGINDTWFDASNLTLVRKTSPKDYNSYEGYKQFWFKSSTDTSLWQIKKVQYPNGIYYIYTADCAGTPIQEVEISQDVYYIHPSAFASNTSLTKWTIRNLEKSILGVFANNVFTGSTNLKNLVLPKCFKLFGGNCFGWTDQYKVSLNSLSLSYPSGYSRKFGSQTLTSNAATNATVANNYFHNGNEWGGGDWDPEEPK